MVGPEAGKVLQVRVKRNPGITRRCPQLDQVG